MLRTTGSIAQHQRRTETLLARPGGGPHSSLERIRGDARRQQCWEAHRRNTTAAHCQSPAPAIATVATAQQDTAAADSPSSGATAPAAPPNLTWMTCRRCKQRFAAEQNHREVCRYHSEGWTGGELAKAIGFVRRSDAPEHQLAAVMGRTGLLRFWDCCGAEEEGAPGCKVSFHTAFDDEENERRGWR
ncbi:hypothetical protein PLESTB_000851400 [Pleodorina starrii]|uniref:Uncharacterized protein n=1 Tax=Pleodorina starrii TaxID=330485 RepID=A0A9W6BLK1_9CHLO|nr:hypothetical protein PLESTM_001441900 [Pleodorina starrii]GLC54324.1 hypothetical protein PLESTB_000851400 [Pleodorina starrii]